MEQAEIILGTLNICWARSRECLGTHFSGKGISGGP
jgi:hypothetical protein